MATTKNGKGNGKLAMADFVTTAILKLRNVEKSKGIHSVFSGFNEAFREYYGLDKDHAIAAVKELEAKGIIKSHFARGGVMLYIPADFPTKTNGHNATATLNKILG